MTFADAIRKLMSKEPLSRAETREAFDSLMKGEATPVQIALSKRVCSDGRE